MANILLTYPKPEYIKGARFGFSLSLLYISSLLKEADHSIDYKDYSVEIFNKNELSELLKEIDLVIVEFDSFPLKRSNNLNNANDLIKFIKKSNSLIKIIAFGKDLALFPRDIKGIDFTFKTEIENNIVELVDELLKDNYILENIDSELVDLDKLPMPDRGLLSTFAEHGGTINRKDNLAKSTLIETSRGCLNTCAFCQRQGWNSKFRTHSIEYILKEFNYIKDKGYINVWIKDDNFTFNLSRAKNILKSLIDNNSTQNMKIALSSWTKIDYELLDLAKKANVSLVSFGIESANKEILDFYCKNIDLDHVQKIITYADKIGIYTVGNFIIGAPMETEYSIEQTFKYALDVPFDQVNIKTLDYMAGSKLYNDLEKEITRAKRHIFACKENDLNQFPLKTLKKKISNFNNNFRKSRKEHFTKKVLKFGLPYELLK